MGVRDREGRWDRFPLKTPSSVDATMTGEGLCSGTGTGLGKLTCGLRKRLAWSVNALARTTQGLGKAESHRKKKKFENRRWREGEERGK